jgi:anaerobic magnesium-protoporphyrin IX monomethyl ester cyclase
VAEMQSYQQRYAVDSFSFYDLTAIVRRSWILEFTALLIAADRRVRWPLPAGTRSEAMDTEVVRQLKRSGCLTLTLAPESGSPRIVGRIRKQVNLEKMIGTIRAGRAPRTCGRCRFGGPALRRSTVPSPTGC